MGFSNKLNHGEAVIIGIKNSCGEYVLLQDADLELDMKDSLEMYQMIQANDEIKCIFGSRYLSGKLKKNNYFFNNLVGKINSLIFKTCSSDSSLTLFEEGISNFLHIFFDECKPIPCIYVNAILTILFCGMLIPAIRAIYI